MIPDEELAALLTRLNAPTPHDRAMAALADLKPEPVCRVCLEALDMRDADVGTHWECDAPPVDARQPPPTLPELSAALIAYERSRERSLQVAIGPSEIGVTCDRRLGYALRNAPRQPDAKVPWAPLIGTALHGVNAEALTADNERLGRQRWLVEQRVYPSPEIGGNTDAYDTDTDTVIDWKVVGKSTVEKALRHGPGQQYEVQAHTYGRGWQRLGYDPRWVRIVFLPRWSHTIDDAYEWTAPYSRAIAERALERVRNLDASLSEDWASVPATPTSDACHFCPYHRPKVQTVDFHGCPGYQSKPAQAVNDYLATLPASTERTTH